MPFTPVDDHTEEFEQLAGLMALDVLDDDERLRFEQHAATCERCRVIVRLDRETLARVAPAMDPSPGFKQRLLDRARQELAAQAQPSQPAAQPQAPELTTQADASQLTTQADASRPTAQAQAPELTTQADASRLTTQAGASQLTTQAQAPRETAHAAGRREPLPPTAAPNVIPFWRRSRMLSALAAVLVIGIVSAGAFSYQNQVVATYPLQGDLAGSALVQIRRNGSAELDLRVVSPPPGRYYEAWIIPEGGKPIAAGITPSGDAQLPLNGLSSGTTIALTREASLVPEPTEAPVMAAVIHL